MPCLHIYRLSAAPPNTRIRIQTSSVTNAECVINSLNKESVGGGRGEKLMKANTIVCLCSSHYLLGYRDEDFATETRICPTGNTDDDDFLGKKELEQQSINFRSVCPRPSRLISVGVDDVSDLFVPLSKHAPPTQWRQRGA